MIDRPKPENPLSPSDLPTPVSALEQVLFLAFISPREKELWSSISLAADLLVVVGPEGYAKARLAAQERYRKWSDAREECVGLLDKLVYAEADTHDFVSALDLIRAEFAAIAEATPE